MYPVIGLALTNLTTNRIAELKVQPTDRNVERNSYESGAGLSGQSLNVKKKKTNATTAIVTRLSKVIPVCVGFDFLRYAFCFKNLRATISIVNWLARTFPRYAPATRIRFDF